MITNKIIIDEVEYGLIRLSPFKSSRVLTRLTKMGAMPLLRALVAIKTESDEKNESFLDKDVDEMFPVIADAIEPLLMNIEEDDLEKLVIDIFANEGFFCDGKKLSTPLAVETKFGEKGLFHMMKVLKWGLGVNFADFLPGLQGVLSAVKK